MTPLANHEAPRGDDTTATLADVLPALLTTLGVAGFTDRLGLRPSRGICLLLVDGLGWEALQDHAADAPFLSSLSYDHYEPITAGFPTTTATSLAALGTGVPAGQHGIVGYTFATPDGTLINTLNWRTHGQGDGVDLLEKFVPEDIQPLPTMLERAAVDGIRVTMAVPHMQKNSGLTRAVLRGAEFCGVHALGDLTSTALSALSGATAVTSGRCAMPITATWICSVTCMARDRCRGGCSWLISTNWSPRSATTCPRAASSWSPPTTAW